MEFFAFLHTFNSSPVWIFIVPLLVKQVMISLHINLGLPLVMNGAYVLERRNETFITRESMAL